MHFTRRLSLVFALALASSSIGCIAASDSEPDESADDGAEGADENVSTETDAVTGCTHSTGVFKFNGEIRGWATVKCSSAGKAVWTSAFSVASKHRRTSSGQRFFWLVPTAILSPDSYW